MKSIIILIIALKHIYNSDIMIGWISLHRKILENPIICKDSDYFAIWCYLLLKATHKNQDKIFKGKRITLKEGQLITGRKVISSVFKISESKVQRILKAFESEQQIEQQTSNANRLITIINWKQYQNNKQQSEQPVNNQRTTSEQPVNTNNNVNKEIKIYRHFAHLKISIEENKKLLQLGYSQNMIDDIYNRIENYSGNKKYKSLYLTALNWLKRENQQSEDMGFIC